MYDTSLLGSSFFIVGNCFAVLAGLWGGLGWLGWAGLGWAGLDWAGLGWAGLGSLGLGWAGVEGGVRGHLEFHDA